jgi:hypothetical protein
MIREINKPPKTDADCINTVNGEAIFTILTHGKAMGINCP